MGVSRSDLPAERMANDVDGLVAELFADSLDVVDEIIERDYNLDIKNPHVAEVINHDPEELLSSYADQQADIQNLRNQLKSILASAIASKS